MRMRLDFRHSAGPSHTGLKRSGLPAALCTSHTYSSWSDPVAAFLPSGRQRRPSHQRHSRSLTVRRRWPPPSSPVPFDAAARSQTLAAAFPSARTPKGLSAVAWRLRALTRRSRRSRRREGSRDPGRAPHIASGRAASPPRGRKQGNGSVRAAAARNLSRAHVHLDDPQRVVHHRLLQHIAHVPRVAALTARAPRSHAQSTQRRRSGGGEPGSRRPSGIWQGGEPL